ncbi:unnamed protein product [Adineta steineri]|uniref:Bis(5'-nucleosyl)-tetraphosphatase [asymmetrical] n=2 Tax=Adineta steineri TaxID=433720 RepID=A0A815M9W4_9BILA|nr:unnamed protein product [Adineta steineri]CAF3823063.1 unnamed protein product [Adineta steineri]
MAENTHDDSLRQVKSCGFLLMKSDQSFLLMRHRDRYDLPKGHMEIGETERETALRELQEETGIQSSAIDIDPDFRFEDTYYPKYKRFGGEVVKKTLVIFLARLKSDSTKVIPSEHGSFRWLNWSSSPPRIQNKTVDSLVEKVHAYLEVSQSQ